MQLGLGGSGRPRIPRSIVAAVLSSSLFVPTSRAQELPNLGRQLSLVVGPLFVSQRDENASPLRYGGAVPFLQIGYAARTSRRTFELRVGSALGTFRSALTQENDLPRQEAWRGWIELEYARLVGAPGTGTRWLLGGRIAAHGTAIVHSFARPAGDKEGYGFFSTTLGPVVAVERRSGEHTTLSARLGVPVLALIGRPYGVFYPIYYDPRPSGVGLRFRVATVDAFQAADFTGAYTVEVRRRTDLVVAYHLVVERYRETRPFRFASQGMSLAVAVRLGGGE